MFYYHSCKGWHRCIECIYNRKRFLWLHRGGGGFHSPCILAIFIRWSAVGFCLYGYHDTMHFNVATITIRKFLLASSTPKRKPRSHPHPKKSFVYARTLVSKPVSSPRTNIDEWVLFSSMVTAVWRARRLCWMLEAGRGGISPRRDPCHAVPCLATRTRWQGFPPISLSNFYL